MERTKLHTNFRNAHSYEIGRFDKTLSNYRKIPIISPGLIFVQKAFLLVLFSGEPIFGGAYYWKEFCVSKWVGLDNKTANTNSPRAYIWEALLSEGFLRFAIWVGGGGGAYFREG